jgi:hypothetical protein
MDKYTTAAKVDEQKLLKSEEQTEKAKVILSSDAYAIADLLDQLNKRLAMK